MRNSYRIVDDVVYIELRRKVGENLETKVSLSDLPKLLDADILWSAQWNGCVKSFYVTGSTRGNARKRKKIILHRFLLDTPPHLEVDHKFHDTLDNRRSEIRNVTRKENMSNRKDKTNGKNKFFGKGYYKTSDRDGFRVAVRCAALDFRKYVKTEEEAKHLVSKIRERVKCATVK